MSSWSTGMTDIYLNNGWYNAVHTSRSVKYSVGHKNGDNFISINS